MKFTQSQIDEYVEFFTILANIKRRELLGTIDLKNPSDSSTSREDHQIFS